MLMVATQATQLERLQTTREWLAFFRNGLIAAFVAAILLFWNSSHSAEQITVAIVVPLIIFNCIPFFLHALAPLLPQPPQRNLPLPAVEPKALPPNRRRNALLAIGIIVSMIICLFGGAAIFLASFTYDYFGIPWATNPARDLALLLVSLSILPIVAVASFIAGMVWTGKIRDSGLALWIYIKALRPLSHWPTFA
jgi:hypothetical protein